MVSLYFRPAIKSIVEDDGSESSESDIEILDVKTGNNIAARNDREPNNTVAFTSAVKSNNCISSNINKPSVQRSPNCALNAALALSKDNLKQSLDVEKVLQELEKIDALKDFKVEFGIGTTAKSMTDIKVVKVNGETSANQACESVQASQTATQEGSAQAKADDPSVASSRNQKQERPPAEVDLTVEDIVDKGNARQLSPTSGDKETDDADSLHCAEVFNDAVSNLDEDSPVKMLDIKFNEILPLENSNVANLVGSKLKFKLNEFNVLEMLDNKSTISSNNNNNINIVPTQDKLESLEKAKPCFLDLLSKCGGPDMRKTDASKASELECIEEIELIKEAKRKLTEARTNKSEDSKISSDKDQLADISVEIISSESSTQVSFLLY